jgi:hypothetical protein
VISRCTRRIIVMLGFGSFSILSTVLLFHRAIAT